MITNYGDGLIIPMRESYSKKYANTTEESFVLEQPVNLDCYQFSCEDNISYCFKDSRDYSFTYSCDKHLPRQCDEYYEFGNIASIMKADSDVKCMAKSIGNKICTQTAHYFVKWADDNNLYLCSGHEPYFRANPTRAAASMEYLRKFDEIDSTLCYTHKMEYIVKESVGFKHQVIVKFAVDVQKRSIKIRGPYAPTFECNGVSSLCQANVCQGVGKAEALFRQQQRSGEYNL